jgi:signal transduction histidine kinase/CheY-like chemotaxis protein
MAERTSGIIPVTLAIIFALTLFSACGNTKADLEGSSVAEFPFTSFLDVPGITSDEIESITALQRQTEFLIYGTTPNTESFINSDGQISGFTVTLCEWMSNMFGIQFKPVIYSWGGLVEGLEKGEVDFTGELTPTEERRKNYFMTDAIAERVIKYFRLEDSRPFAEIAELHPLRYAFFTGTTTWRAVTNSFSTFDYETVFIDDSSHVYEMLKSGEIDAFFNEGPGEYAFDVYTDVVTHSFVPLIYEPVSLATRKDSLASIISVTQKAILNGGRHYLAHIYNLGYDDYLKYKLYTRLNEEERAYMHNNHTIRFAVEYDNYPISFYNTHEKEWQGVAFDVINRVERLTGFKFEVANDHNANWPELLEMLKTGEAVMITELLRTEEREGHFVWPKNFIYYDNFALISKSEFPNLSLNEILNVRVALRSETAYTEMFNSWFPNHAYAVNYQTHAAAFGALTRGEVDIVMSSRKELLAITNYDELPGYKANFIFDRTADSTFGFRAEEKVLAAIVDKALGLIDINALSGNWMYKTYDYRAKVAEARLPLFVGAIVLTMMVLTLMLIMFFQSRSEGKRLEKQVAEQTKEVRNVSEAKSRFVANMSHEMRTPMNVIVGLTDLLLEEDDVSVRIKETLKKINTAGTTLMGLINDVLDISKVEAGKLELVPVQYDVASLLNDIITFNIIRIGEKPITFVLDIKEDLPKSLFGDDLRVKQILNNLLSNAFKYTKEGTVTFSVSCHLVDAEDAERAGVWVSFKIQDTGIGIRDEDISKLFSDYNQVDTQANRTIEGTGLGLSITKKFVDLMDGEITVESEYGKGTSFIATLRQGFVTDQTIGKETAENLRDFRYSENKRQTGEKLVRSDLSYARVLVVDDFPMNLDVAAGMLRKYKMKVDCVLTGQESIDLITAKEPVYDAVFMDHMMPGMDGIEAIKIIRASGTEYARKIPIIALTANAVAGSEQMFIENGFNAFLPKPFNAGNLDKIVQLWVRDKSKE